MKYIYTIILSTIILFTLSCKKRQDASPIPPTTENLNVIWSYAFPDSLVGYGSLRPILYENSVVSSYQPIINPTVNEIIFSLNKTTGAVNWSWNNYIRPVPQKIRGANRNHKKNNSLFVCSSQDNYSIDIPTGETNWATNNEAGNPRTSQWGDLLFHTETYGETPIGDSSNILIRNLDNGNWKKVFGITKSDEYHVNFETPGIYLHQNGDTLIIFQNRQIVLSTPFAEKVDLYCYNLSSDSIVWFTPNLTPSGSSNIQTPLVEGDLVYFGGKWDFYCIDILSGEIIWSHHFYYDFQGSNFLIHNDLIITNLDNGDLIAIDKFTGNQVWVNEGLSVCCAKLRVYEDRIYFGNLSLFIVNANTGETLYKFKSPNYKKGGEFYNAIAVDLINKKMYTTDRKYLYCFDLPD